jgi:hypothetical protein
MATVRYTGNAAPAKQVITLQVTAYDATTTYNVIMNGKTLAVIAAGGVNATASALQALMAASTAPPEFREVTWTVSTDTITGTAITAGKPFTLTKSVIGGTGTLGSVTTTTANSGPSDMTCVANYDAGALPSAADTLIIENSNIDLLYGLDQITNSLTAVTIRNWKGKIGLPQWNGLYNEYRPTYLILKATTLTIQNVSSGFIRIDSSSVQTTVNIYGTGNSSDPQGFLPAFCWKGTHASNVVNLYQGSLGVAMLTGETATILTFNQGFISNPQSDTQAIFNSGTTLTTINRDGGTLEINSAVTTINQRKGVGDLTIKGTGAVTTINSLDGGNIYYMTTGTLTTGNIGAGCTLDCRRDLNARTVTTLNMYKGSAFLDPLRKVTVTNPVNLKGCLYNDVTIDRGIDQTVTV